MKKLVLLLISLAILTACTTSKDQIKKMIKDNPDIITDAIEANPSQFIEALNKAVKAAQADQAKKRESDEKKKLEEAFDKPLKAEIRSDELIRGTKGAPLTLVEYSDFECPFCSRGYKTVMTLLEKYKGKIQFVYKHLPLDFHPNAMPASIYYEAIRLQNHDKAVKFHDGIYENQKKLQNGEKFLKELAKKVGADMSKLAKDVKSDALKKRVESDIAEAHKYGFQGTPGFLLNGIPVKGAYPIEHFEKLIEELKKRGKVQL
jgi:protein-disulfide isomerase